SAVLTGGLVIEEDLPCAGCGTGGWPHLKDAMGSLHGNEGHGRCKVCEDRNVEADGVGLRKERGSAAVAGLVKQFLIAPWHEARYARPWVYAHEKRHSATSDFAQHPDRRLIAAIVDVVGNVAR